MNPRRLTEEEYREMQARVRGGLSRGGHLDSRARPSRARNSRKLANPAPAPTPYKSKLEARFAQYVEILRRLVELEHYWYEPVTFKLPGGVRYTPDFLIQRGSVGPSYQRSGRMEFHEVKGHHKNKRDSLTRLKIAAALHPWARWCLVEWQGGRWKETWL